MLDYSNYPNHFFFLEYALKDDKTLITQIIKTFYLLGLINLWRVFVYRLQIKTGFFKFKLPISPLQSGYYFHGNSVSGTQSIPCPNDAQDLLEGRIRIFSKEFKQMSTYPDWFHSDVEGYTLPSENHWSDISDFDHGDIKFTWDISRFHWIVLAAQGYVATRKNDYLTHIDKWLNNWATTNPVNQGPNWKCGQEASIRTINLCIAALILDNVRQPSSSLLELVRVHLKRIDHTTPYAIAQNNNHSTSEAAALFMGGTWLASQGYNEGHKWASIGRRLLEKQVEYLVDDHGTFSQYSVNYQRFLVDTLSITEIWRKKLSLVSFSNQLLKKAKLAVLWLFQMTNDVNGYLPNLGANDGTKLFQLDDCEYADFRSSIQLGYAIFHNKVAFCNEGEWNQTLKWLNVKTPNDKANKDDYFEATKGGFTVVHNNGGMILFRYPKFNFRPSQADALHVDFWINGVNIFRDGGTYKYNTSKELLNYFSGVESHCTIQFDGRDQMKRMSRFLYMNWLKTTFFKNLTVDDGQVSFSAGYKDAFSAEHIRKILLSNDNLIVDDTVKGFSKTATLRWRLPTIGWSHVQSSHLKDETLFRVQSNNGISIVISTPKDSASCKIVEGWESLHYGEKTKIPVFECTTFKPGNLKTKIMWQT